MQSLWGRRLWGPERLVPGAYLVACLCTLRCLVNFFPLARTLAQALMPPVSVAPLSREEVTSLYVPGILCTAALWPLMADLHHLLSCGWRKRCRAVLKGALPRASS